MEAYRVSRTVNAPRNNREDLLLQITWDSRHQDANCPL